MPTALAPSPYLLGPYAPISTELEAELTVEGEVPLDLDGLYVRNGPNPRFSPPGRYHWFDGDGMLHGVRIQGGKIKYRNRWVRTLDLEDELAEGQALFGGVMEPITRRARTAAYKDTANTDVIFHAGRLHALWYISGAPYAVDPNSLQTIGVSDFGGRRSTLVSAHAKVDPRTNELTFFSYGPKPPFMHYGVVGADGVLSHQIPIELPGPRLPHDMAITERFSILMDLPLFFDEAALREKRWVTKMHDLPARFAIVPRHGGADSVRWFEAEPCYMYHTVNAWEEGNKVVLLGCRVDDPLPAANPRDGAYGKMMANLRVQAHLHRWTFDLDTGLVHEERVDDQNIEFPSMHRGRLGTPTRYGYYSRLSVDRTMFFDALVKHDDETGTTVRYEYGEGRHGSEAPFAPSTQARAEDDGYLLSFVHDEREQRSELWIFDARAVADGPVARALLPQRVPLGFHATWVPGTDLKQGAGA